jgi:8-oxo-dGTP diphosphatase
MTDQSQKDKKFFVGIKGVIKDTEGRFLMVQDMTKHDFWDVPGGKIDANETVQEALAREIAEELPGSTNLRIGELLYVHRLQKDLRENTSLVLVFYAIELDFPNGVHLSEEHRAYEWLHLDEVRRRASEGVAELTTVL